MTYRATAREVEREPSTVFSQCKKAHVRAAIDAGCLDVANSGAVRLKASLDIGLSALEDVAANGTGMERVQAAKTLVQLVAPKQHEVKVGGMAEMIAAAVAEMTDEELGINDAENEPTP